MGVLYNTSMVSTCQIDAVTGEVGSEIDLTVDYRDIITRQRDGFVLEDEELYTLVRGIAENEVTDGQIASYAMASHLHGMTADEVSVFTECIKSFDKSTHWSDANQSICECISLGDNYAIINLIVAPIVAACGISIPVVATPNNPHAGQAVAAFHSILEREVEVDREALSEHLSTLQFCMGAFKRVGGVANQRLSSVLNQIGHPLSDTLNVCCQVSEHLSVGAYNIVYAVPVGRHLRIRTQEDAIQFASRMSKVGQECGMYVSSFLLDSSFPLAYSMGHVHQMREVIDFLNGTRRHPHIEQVVSLMVKQLLLHAGVTDNPITAEAKMRDAISSGKALAKLESLVLALGGEVDAVEQYYEKLPEAPFSMPIHPEEEGVVKAYDMATLERSVRDLQRENDEFIAFSGLSGIVEIGTNVDRYTPIAWVHGSSEEKCEEIAQRIKHSTQLGLENKPRATPILEVIRPNRFEP